MHISAIPMSTSKFWIISTQIPSLSFSEKKKSSVKNQKKSHACLQLISICTSYLELILQLQNKRKRSFNISMYFILNITCFVVSLDSSACLGNNILPNMFSLILHPHPLPPPKKIWSESHKYRWTTSHASLQFFKAGTKYSTLKVT